MLFVISVIAALEKIIWGWRTQGSGRSKQKPHTIYFYNRGLYKWEKFNPHYKFKSIPLLSNSAVQQYNHVLLFLSQSPIIGLLANKISLQPSTY
jgi:hypothetical protein